MRSWEWKGWGFNYWSLFFHSIIELTKTLDEFNKSSCRELQDKMGGAALEQMRQSSQCAADYISSWSDTFTQEHANYSSATDKSEESVFSEMYHSLIHSAALETLLQLENTYAIAMDDVVSKKANAIKAMEEKYDRPSWLSRQIIHSSQLITFNPLSPRSDQHVTSPHDIHSLSRKEVIRILKLIW